MKLKKVGKSAKSKYVCMSVYVIQSSLQTNKNFLRNKKKKKKNCTNVCFCVHEFLFKCCFYFELLDIKIKPDQNKDSKKEGKKKKGIRFYLTRTHVGKDQRTNL